MVEKRDLSRDFLFVKKESKKAQLAIFVIVALVLVAGVVIFFIVRQSVQTEVIPQDLKPVYEYFTSCIEYQSEGLIQDMESRGGYLEMPDFEAGSPYMPFSNQLNFLGFGVPYWSYVSGNGFQKEQIPTINHMQDDLGNAIARDVDRCNFDQFRERGYSIELTESRSAVTKISEHNVEVSLNAPIKISKGNQSITMNSHKVSIKTELGGLYNSAKNIYLKQKEGMIFENFTVDTLYMYAPVTGVELTCSPKVWSPYNVSNILMNALAANFANIKSEGNYYQLNNNLNKYFVKDFGTKDSVNFLVMENWPHKIEISPVDGNLMIAQPVGTQEGLGILGFCYVPYHFVYNLAFPVLVQVYRNSEVFQFPVGVVIKNNRPPQPGEDDAVVGSESDVCRYKNTQMTVNTYDAKLRPISADIYFKCLDTTCRIGKSVGGTLTEKFPQCINGYIIAKSEDYAQKKIIASTNYEGTVDLILDKKYELTLKVLVNGRETNDNTIVIFDGGEEGFTSMYPQQRTIKISEGLYNVSVQSFSKTSISLASKTVNQCVDVPEVGIASMFGFDSTTKNCFDVTIPSQTLNEAFSAGGQTDGVYIFGSDLEKSKVMIINVPEISRPATLEDIQKNYEAYDSNQVEVSFI